MTENTQMGNREKVDNKHMRNIDMMENAHRGA